jgi:hypothetical protein
MTASYSENERKENRESKPKHLLRLPGLLSDDDIGLGDVVKKTTYALGIKSCSGCEKRAQILNRWVTFTGRPSR